MNVLINIKYPHQSRPDFPPNPPKGEQLAAETIDKNKGIEKISAKEVITRTDLQNFHSDLAKHLEHSLGHEIDILNEATREGNKSIFKILKY